MLQKFPAFSTQPNSHEEFIKILGTGAANPTKVEGKGLTITRTGTGAYRVTWAESPGRYLGLKSWSLEATTPADLKNYSVVVDAPFDTTNRRLDFVVYNSGGTATDLAAAQWIALTVAFARTAL